ncbi:hypothetical protein AB4Y43_38915 [Paraburkholderia sp. BR10872]|uniref:hypothetical protein n=1 Tax=Paraburkholderia sp. BR10872 TaxID=3236989 RepID=UPI0034D33322
MKRITFFLIIATIALGFGIAGCNKAHKAGNDSMDATRGTVAASGGQVNTVREALAESSAASPAALANTAASASSGH